MSNLKKEIVSNLQAAVGLEVLYELFCDSTTKKPVITYLEANDKDVAIGDTLGYSRVNFYIKLWGDNLASLEPYREALKAEMRRMGFVRESYNELVMGSQICMIWLFQGLYREVYEVDEVNATKLSDYLYSIEYKDWDYKNAKFYKPAKAACSSVTKGNLAGRNFDWYYDDKVNFVIKCKGKSGCHDSIGVANSRITKAGVESKKWAETYAQLPFMTTDGINDAGVYCNINVVPCGDKGITTGQPGIHKKKLCQAALVRFILDYADSADDAIQKLRGVNVYAQNGLECHLMIYDGVKSYIVEWINNEMKVTEGNIMTNFYLDGWNGEVKSVSLGNSVEEVQATGLTDHAQGLERYLILQDMYEDNDVKDALEAVNYTKTYTDGEWYSEFNDGDLTVYSDAEDYSDIISTAQQEYQNKKRDGKVWVTKHRSIYNIENKTVSVSSEEEDTYFDFTL